MNKLSEVYGPASACVNNLQLNFSLIKWRKGLIILLYNLQVFPKETDASIIKSAIIASARETKKYTKERGELKF